MHQQQVGEGDNPLVGSTEYQQKYEKFDAMALVVMERNNDRLEQDNELLDAELADTPDVVVRFDVVTASNREQNGSTVEINLLDMVTDAYCATTGLTSLPSRCCIVESLAVESATNSLPIDVCVRCKQPDLLRGSFKKGKVEGEESAHQKASMLFVAHANTQMHLSTGREVCSANNFTQKSTFRRYRQALKKDVEDSATLINGGMAMEYLSPWAVLVTDDVVNGDWFMNIIYQNPSSFQHQVQAIRTQHAPEHKATDDAGGEAEEKFGISLRMHLDDWQNLHSAVQANVLDPLRQNIIDLDHNPLLGFVVEPANISQSASETPQSIGIVSKNSATAWRQKAVAGHAGRCAVSLKMTLKFV